MNILPKPICAVCNKPVEKMVVSHGFGCEKVNVLVECHGDKAEYKIDPFVMFGGEIILDKVFKNTTVAPVNNKTKLE